jgi:nicotinate-nucleotide pyrophosphorylase (carboxylating)
VRDADDLPLPEVYARLTADGSARRLLELAREEDLGSTGDITTGACVPPHATGTGEVIARWGGVVSGLEALPDVLTVYGASLEVERRCRDGDRAPPGATLAVLRGPKREILVVERTLLNLLGRLSGIATRTAAFVDALGRGVRARVYDTRKTTPGLRSLEKYAVRCGGGRNHRRGLFDAMLIKDNHLAGVPQDGLARFVTEAAGRARAAGAEFVEVEVGSVEMLERVLSIAPGMVDIVLLDNMGLDDLRRAVALRDARRPGVELEASGGVTLQTVRAVAETGVDRISVGSLTHGAASLDVALDIVAGGGT